MKKLLVLMLVLGMASLANATVIDVVTVGVGSLGHAGVSTDPLRGDLGETIEIKIVLNHNPYSGYSSYDGYLLSSMDLALDLSGPGTLAPGTLTKVGDPLWQYDAGLNPFVVTDADPNDGLDSIGALAMTPIQGAADLVWDLIITCTGDGNLTLDLSINGQSDYSPYSTPSGGPYPNPPGWVTMVNADLKDLVIHQVPEPATIALLGLGGLCLLRRRR